MSTSGRICIGLLEALSFKEATGRPVESHSGAPGKHSGEAPMGRKFLNFLSKMAHSDVLFTF